MKTAIVTGASKGIGWATVQALLEEGYKVSGWSRGPLPGTHENLIYSKVDVSDERNVIASFEDTMKEFGHLDVLVNNAGLGFEGTIEEMETSLWKQMFDVNVHGIFHCSKMAIPVMKSQEIGHIINIASIAANTGIPGMAGYCGTKFAVKGISHSMYKEIRKYGIKVTCIYPGSVHTNFFDSIPSVELNEGMMKPEDIAGTILHCLSSSPNYHHVDIEVRPLKPVRS